MYVFWRFFSVNHFNYINIRRLKYLPFLGVPAQKEQTPSGWPTSIFYFTLLHKRIFACFPHAGFTFKLEFVSLYTMIRTKYIYILVIALSSSLLLSSCFLFRGKNHCDTCPSFNHKGPKKRRH